MPNPVLGDVHIAAALTDISVAYTQAQDIFVASRVIGSVPTIKQSDKYFLWSRQDFFRADAQQRAAGTESAGSGPRLTTDIYFCDRWAIHTDVTDPERANADPAINLDADLTEYVTEQILLRQEIDFQQKLLSSGIWSGGSNGTGDLTGQSNPASTTANFRQWNDVSSTPIEDIRGEMTNVAKVTGRKPNTLVLGPKTWTALADHPDVLDRIKYTEKGIVTTDLLASLLDLDTVRVTWAVQDTQAELSTGASSTGNAFIFSNAALLAFFETSPGLRKPTAAYKFVWTLPTGIAAPREGARIKRYRLPESMESDRIEGEAWWQFKVVAADLASYFVSCTP